jgi:hypothetical protein
METIDRTKSNLKIKARKKQSEKKKKIRSERKNDFKNKIEKANLILGLDNGVSRKYSMHYS